MGANTGWKQAGRSRAREVAIRRTVLAKSRSGGPRAREVAIIMLAMAMTAATVRVRFSPLSRFSTIRHKPSSSTSHYNSLVSG